MNDFNSLINRIERLEKHFLLLAAGNLRTEALRKLEKCKTSQYKNNTVEAPVETDSETAINHFTDSLDSESLLEISKGILKEQDLSFVQGERVRIPAFQDETAPQNPVELARLLLRYREWYLQLNRVFRFVHGMTIEDAASMPTTVESVEGDGGNFNW